uniref:Oxidoreductase n=1 Tax=Coccidioides posadasii RMSCC 3488 TaxID=454284 RepID=A0A0J6I974_COCPO|nr:oxidoreductase [Coccidioides posadasii RMSCC 3488]
MAGTVCMDQDSTIHLPRILCLHGGGTNARIFRMQCRVLERTLRSTFRLVYAQAPFPAQPGPDVTSVYKNFGPFKGWLQATAQAHEYSAQNVAEQIHDSVTAARCADNLLGATGQFVGLLGFSQGAKIAASILFAQQYGMGLSGGQFDWPDLRFAVLLAGRGPLVWLTPQAPMPHGVVDPTSPAMLVQQPFLADDSDEHILRLPTIHVHGLNDPGIDLHRELLNQYCDPNSATLLEWEGAHSVPTKSKDVKAVVERIYSVAQENQRAHIYLAGENNIMLGLAG